MLLRVAPDHRQATTVRTEVGIHGTLDHFAGGAGKFAVQGKLSIKGTSKDVTVPVALAQVGGVTTATGQFAIKRNEFKVGEGEWADTSQLADDVIVKFRIALSGVGPL